MRGIPKQGRALLSRLRQNPATLARKLLSRGACVLRTGYWHTGERCCPDLPDHVFVNQLKVYKFASQFCEGKRVLDVGCGTGYGTSCVGESARFAVGIDLSAQAIRYARRHFSNDKVRFLRMNAESLAFPDGSFDFVISTENFEHLANHRSNLREMARVLADGGMLFLATPNPEMFLGITNPFHTREFMYDDILEHIRESFGECLISENLLNPETHEGRALREARHKKGVRGIDLSTDPSLWGVPIDNRWLSNTHSFFCFARTPRRERKA